VTCQGDHEVQWGFDDDVVGENKFYDTVTVHQVWKLPGGGHTFWVRADCGHDEVRFAVGG
jgi:hypothetical protein